MQVPSDEERVLRIAAWMWIGYLSALVFIDTLIYIRAPHFPATLYYSGNALLAAFFLLLAYWDWAEDFMGAFFYPFMVILISIAPLLLHHLLVPRFPPGPLANAEGIALRQMPVLFIALALTAWRYHFSAVILFSLGTAFVELWAILALTQMPPKTFIVFIFIIAVRSVSLLVAGIFISQLMSRLRRQGESLQKANTQLAHYASTLENLTVSRERNRMARELHDTLAHTLTGLSVTLETIKAYWDVDVDKARELLEKSLETTRTGLEETRRALKSLRASPLEDDGLGPALRKMATATASRANLSLELVLPASMSFLAPDVEQTVYRIAQEAIENTASHANATSVRVELHETGQELQGRGLQLVIQDDGIGFDPNDKASTGHFGLVGMKERAELAGGRLKIESVKGKGTRVVLEI